MVNITHFLSHAIEQNINKQTTHFYHTNLENFVY